MDEEEESRMMAKTIALIAGATGAEPSGWLSPRGTPSSETARLAAEQGLVWFGDVFDEDAPYPMATAGGEIVAVPLKMAVNDLPHHVRYGHSPRSFLEAFHDAFDAIYSSGGDGFYMDVTVHAHVFGRPHAAWVFREIAEHVAGFSDVWVPTRLELAQWALANLPDPT
jgi:peptidoglycan/xylan/chitin deacetylase (PgdA/CDA1 family)